MRAIVLDRLEDFLLLLFAHARQFAQLALARQLLDAFQVADLVRAPQQRDRLRAEALDLQQLEHRRAVLLQQLGVQRDAPGLVEILQVRAHALADAGNFEQLLGFGNQRPDGLVERFDGFGGAAIGADAEGIVAVDLHQVGGFVQDGGDGLVVERALFGHTRLRILCLRKRLSAIGRNVGVELSAERRSPRADGIAKKQSPAVGGWAR